MKKPASICARRRGAARWDRGRIGCADGKRENAQRKDGAAGERYARPLGRAAENGVGRSVHRRTEPEGAGGIQCSRRRDRPEQHRNRAGDGESRQRRSGAQALHIRDGAEQARDREPRRREDR
jgi:hypothetical protein